MTKHITNGERLMRLETQIEDMKEDFKELKNNTDKIYNKIDEFMKVYATKEEVDVLSNLTKSNREKIDRIKEKIIFYSGGISVLVFLITLLITNWHVLFR